LNKDIDYVFAIMPLFKQIAFLDIYGGLMKLHCSLALGLLVFSCFDHYKISGAEVPPGLECFSAEELQELEQVLQAAGQNFETYISSHPEEWAKFCDAVTQAEAESKANPVKQKTKYNPYKFGFSVFQYDEKTAETVFIGSRVMNTSDLDYSAYLSASYPPLYWTTPSLTGDVRDYIEYVGIDMYKRKDEQDYVLELKAKDILGSTYKGIRATIPKRTIEKILTDTQFDYKSVPLNRYGTEYVLATHTLEGLIQPQVFSAFKFMVTVANIALKSADLPELRLDDNDLKIKFDFRRKWLSWDTWTRWLQWL
jgi:hypothetical protein